MRIVRILLLVLAAAAWPQARAGAGFVDCNSIGDRCQYCPVDTQGRVVMVRENSTGHLCRQGTGWGYDSDGIWVDRGCRAQFSDGRNDGGGNWGGHGVITWANGNRSWFAREGPGVLVGDVDTGKHFCFRRNA